MTSKEAINNQYLGLPQNFQEGFKEDDKKRQSMTVAIPITFRTWNLPNISQKNHVFGAASSYLTHKSLRNIFLQR